MYSNRKAIKMFEQMVKMGDYFSSGRPVYVSPQIILNDICSKITLGKSDIILDVGCGTGLLTIPLARKCKYVYALDAGRKVLEKARINYQKKRTQNIVFCEGLATDLPFKNKLFDKVIMYSAIHYLENMQQVKKCIRELIRVCKAGGFILIAEVPEKKAKEEFASRNKTNAELKILDAFKNRRKEYDRLFKEKVTVDSGANSLSIDGDMLVEFIRKQGYSANILNQDIRQPFSLTRRDIVISLNRTSVFSKTKR